MIPSAALRRDAQSAADAVDRLMVRRVRRDRRRADDSREVRSWLDRRRGCTRSSAPAGLIVVDAARPLRRDVLHERAAERDVHDLRAAADRERGDASLVGRAGQRELVAVAPAMRRARFGVRGLPKMRRVDVLAAGEHESRDVGQRRDGDYGIDRRQDERDESGRGEGVGVRLVDANA